jgi:subtilisin family serine protease
VIAQIAPAAKLASFAACRDEPGGASARCWSSALVRALDAAVAARIRIALLGWRGPEDVQVARALERAAKAGVLLIAPVGDSGDERAPAFPASHPDVLGVTAVDRQRAVFAPAARGEAVELAAPGVDVQSSVPDAQSSRSLSGSPLAAAHAAGVAALLLELSPRANAARLREVLVASAVDLGEAGRDPVFGHGLIDACAAARALVVAGSEDPCPEAQ